MTQKHIGLIAAFDEPSRMALERIRLQLRAHGLRGRQTTSIPHHLTIGTFPLDRRGEVYRALEKVPDRKFSLRLGHIGLFGTEVLFLGPDPNRQIAELRETFEPYTVQESWDWTPHVTMLIDESGEVIRAIPVVAANFTGMTVQVTHLQVYEFWPAELLREKELK